MKFVRIISGNNTVDRHEMRDAITVSIVRSAMAGVVFAPLAIALHLYDARLAFLSMLWIVFWASLISDAPKR